MSKYTPIIMATESMLKHPAFADYPARPAINQPPTAPLNLSMFSLSSDLAAMGCSNPAMRTLDAIFQRACRRSIEDSQAAYARIASNIGECSSADEPGAEDYLSSVAIAISTKYERHASYLREEMLRQTEAAMARDSPFDTRHHLHGLSAPPRQSLYTSRCPLLETHSEPTGTFTAEVVSILQKAFDTSDTLTRAEVKGLIGITGLSTKQIRTWFANQRQRRGRKLIPYISPRRPTTQRHSGPVRSVSNSSTSSSSSSLISYDDFTPNNFSPPPQHHQLYPPPSSVDQLEPHPPAQSEEDSQMSDSAPSNPTSIYALPDVGEPSTYGAPLPSAPSTADTDRFFSPQQQLPIPSPDSHSNALFDFDYTSSTETSFEDASPLDHLQRSDPFLDDQFLKNVLGTLGVTQGGGLTLCMDSFQDDEAVIGESVELPSIGGGEGGNGMSFGW
ncbi:hypothetical protein JCM11491_003616 [Sporobolomyces phaffii]